MERRSQDSAVTPVVPPSEARRSRRSHESILEAATELLESGGYRNLTIEMIAKKAGVGKQTIYRWWRSKADIVLEAEIVRADQNFPQPDTGNLLIDLKAVLLRYVEIFDSPRLHQAWSGLVAEAQLDPQFGASFHGGFVTRRRELFRLLFAAAAQRGDLRPGCDVELLVDLVHGAMWYRLLGPRPLTKQYALRVAKMVQSLVVAESSIPMPSKPTPRKPAAAAKRRT